MKKAFFFLVLLLFLAVSCSNGNDNDNRQNGQNGQADSSSSDFALSSSDVAMPSSSSSATQSSSSSATQSSSSVETQSSSDGDAMPSSSSIEMQSSSSSETPPPSGGFECTDPISTTASDYSDMDNWIVFTDSTKLTKDVDIFLLYPTSINSGTGADVCPYLQITNSEMRRNAASWYNGVKALASTHANVYAPYYRQPPIGCSGNSSMTGGAAMEDVVAAFQYYLTHINKGERPFMTLGFSQGSLPLWELAENRFEKICGTEFGAATRKNHIVTYATGIPYRNAISASKPVKFSTSYNDINVITAWNSYYESDTTCTTFGVRAIGGPVTNPITWTTDQNYHEMTENPKLNQNTIKGARSHEKLGILLVKRKTEPATDPGCGGSGNMYMGQHGNDIPYFSESIKQNMQDRIEAWNVKYK